MDYIVCIHCSHCQFRTSQRSPRRSDLLKDGSTQPSLTKGPAHTFNARKTRQEQLVKTREEIAGFCTRCMDFNYVTDRSQQCPKCQCELSYFSGKPNKSILEIATEVLTGKAARCSFCHIWLDRSHQLICGKCKQPGLHGINQPMTVQ